jgi:hypothetical protein
MARFVAPEVGWKDVALCGARTMATREMLAAGTFLVAGE